jgi:hypothetical protein
MEITEVVRGWSRDSKQIDVRLTNLSNLKSLPWIPSGFGTMYAWKRKVSLWPISGHFLLLTIERRFDMIVITTVLHKERERLITKPSCSELCVPTYLIKCDDEKGFIPLRGSSDHFIYFFKQFLGVSDIGRRMCIVFNL